MAEQQDDKSRLPLTGIFALLAMAGSFLIYEGISLKTSRPIDKETPSHVFLGKGLIQSRLWQDPFEAIESYRLQEEKGKKGGKEEKQPASGSPGSDPHTLHTLMDVIRDSGIQSGLRVLPVFVDGSPYVNGVESRLKDRYAMISALGAAGYVPESGEFIRVFRWSRENAAEPGAEATPGSGSQATLIPVEFFIPKAKLRNERYGKHVLVMWLRDQDFGLLDDLLTYLDGAFMERLALGEVPVSYRVLGPRSSATLSAMLKTLQDIQSSPLSDPPFRTIKDIRFYSPWATAEDTFLLDYSVVSAGLSDIPAPSFPNGPETEPTVDELFAYPRLEFIRTIKTDALLAEQLLQELRRRKVDLKPCTERHCNPKIALISEWDTLYGRALPRTFAAVAMNNGSGETGPGLKAQVDKLRRDEWPGWIYTHSYLAGLDGELPAKDNDETAPVTQTGAPSWSGKPPQGSEENAGQRPEGRGQLDYVLRLAASLKQEETRNGEEFKSIGILGSDIYDKLLLLQALRQQFPRAIFFTTDLNARLAWPGQWQWTRNVVIASHYGLELNPRLQAPIPPFRDGYQTSLFYTALWALDHFVPAGAEKPDCPDCFRLRGDNLPQATYFSANPEPRLYEVGRSGAFDISVDKRPLPDNAASIYSPRPDMERWEHWSSQAGDLKWMAGAAGIAMLLLLAAMLLSGTVTQAVTRLVSSGIFWLGLAAVAVISYGLLGWMRKSLTNAGAEPMTLTEGISAWPTAAIRLLALAAALIFLVYSWWKLKKNENVLERDFNLDPGHAAGATAGITAEAAGPNAADYPAGDAMNPLARKANSPRLQRLLHRIAGLHFWPSPMPAAARTGAGETGNVAAYMDAAHLWHEYKALGALPGVAMRCLPQAALGLLFAFLTMMLLGFPHTPCRGEACFELNHVVVMLGVGAMTLLVFYVIDIIRLCRRWVNCIAAGSVTWPEKTVSEIAAQQGRPAESRTHYHYIEEWLGIELIGQRTRIIGNLIYFPFVVMFLLAIARHTYFDNWDFPTGLVIVLTVEAILIVIAALILRRAAAAAKKEALGRLEKQRNRLSGDTPDEARQRCRIEWAIEAIRNNQTGAFLPFTRHPVFGASVAMPSGAYGIVLLIEYLATTF
jgi:hypothetical protein